MSRIVRNLCALLCALAWVLPAVGAERFRAAGAADGTTVILDDGSTLRLAAVRVPAGGAGAARDAGLAAAAQAALDGLVRGRVLLVEGAERFDRHGRRLVQPVLEDGTRPALALLSAGLVRIEIPEEAGAGLAGLYAAEAAARAEGGGIWARPEFAVLDAAAVPAGRSGRFAIVEGRVVEADAWNGRGYLNFGPDWKTDFTITATPRDMRAMKRAGLDWAGFAGRRVRVRGWLEDYNGPMIEIRSVAAIEVLDE